MSTAELPKGIEVVRVDQLNEGDVYLYRNRAYRVREVRSPSDHSRDAFVLETGAWEPGNSDVFLACIPVVRITSEHPMAHIFGVEE